MKSELSSLQALESALGEHPSEVVGTLASVVETLLQLEAIFSYLGADLAGNTTVPPRARALVQAGLQLAGLSAGVAETRVGELRAALAEAGWMPPGAGR